MEDLELVFFIFKININLCSLAYFKSHQNLLPSLVVLQQEVAWGEQFKSFLEAIVVLPYNTIISCGYFEITQKKLELVYS